MKSTQMFALAVAALALGACSDEDPSGVTSAGIGRAPSVQVTATTAEDLAPSAPDEGESLAAPRSGRATLRFADGEVLAADVTCVLDPAAVGDGDEMRYYAVSTSLPYLDVTVFAAQDPRAEVSWDAQDASWIGNPDVVATLTGTTIAGHGSFSANGDGADSREATFEVDCNV